MEKTIGLEFVAERARKCDKENKNWLRYQIKPS